MAKSLALLRRWIVPLLAAAAVSVLPLMTTDKYLLKLLTFVGLNVIVVAGLALLFGYAGQISLGHAAFFGIGAYSSAYVTTALGWPFVAGAATAVAVSALGGMLLALPSLRLKGHYLAMATLGFSEIASILFVEAKPITGGTDGLSGIAYASLGGFRFDTPATNYWLVWGVALLVLLAVTGIVRMRPGRAMSALHGSELGAQACGVDPTAVKVSAFIVSAGLAGLAGCLYAHFLGFISPSSFGIEVSIILVAMVVLGGPRSLAGPVVAAVLLTLLPYIDSIVPGLSRETAAFIQDWKGDLYGVVIIAVMLFAPGGISGTARGLRSWLSRLRAGAGTPRHRREPGEEAA
jgi:branched-chain amino acid transport system permease protein